MNIHEGNNSHNFCFQRPQGAPLLCDEKKRQTNSGKNRKVNENEILQTAADFHWKVFSRIFVVVVFRKRNKILGLNSGSVV
jgi:hypothetical protein